jgi:hypothetical protein
VNQETPSPPIESEDMDVQIIKEIPGPSRSKRQVHYVELDEPRETKMQITPLETIPPESEINLVSFSGILIELN